MSKAWYEDWFADERYLALYHYRNSEEASLALDLIEKATSLKKDAAILDLACGAGRHSISLAKRGYTNITAIDLSPTLIREAKKNADAEKVEIRFERQDMRSFSGSFDLIMNLFTSFGYFDEDEENEEVIAQAGKRLNPGGYFVIDFFNSVVIRRDIVAYNEKILPSGERVEQLREIINNRIQKKIRIFSGDHSTEFYESVRLFELQDFERMFAHAGILIKEKFGDYYGAPFESGSSPRLILVGKKNEKE
jgi:cyclopropane fatty-acyl-phospholipid synthase-like methyltransferase